MADRDSPWVSLAGSFLKLLFFLPMSVCVAILCAVAGYWRQQMPMVVRRSSCGRDVSGKTLFFVTCSQQFSVIVSQLAAALGPNGQSRRDIWPWARIDYFDSCNKVLRPA
jgi:hypothetical protein